MIDFLLGVVDETWFILKEASVFLLFGFVIAGLLAVLVPSKTLMRFFGTGRVRSVLWASLIGAPLPLCSCGVLPTAIALRRQGASKGATVAFLISTPETGVDSISLSYALLDPIMTVFRPVAAVLTAIVAGLATNFLGEPRRQPHAPAPGPEQAPSRLAAGVGEAAAPSLDLHVDHGHGHDHDHDHDQDQGASAPGLSRERLLGSLRAVYRYAFRELLDETSYWLVLGIVLSAIVAAALPPDLFEGYLGQGLPSMLIMLAIGIPIYTCASASTPIAAALVMKGLNPGAALVFLLAGPATNLGSLVVLTKFLGARIVAIYLASIVIVTLAAGYALNWIYQTWAIDPRASFGAATGFVPESVKIGAALVLIALFGQSLWRSHLPGEWIWLRDRFAALTGVHVSARRLGMTTLAGALVLYAGSGLFAVAPGEVAIKLRFGRIVAEALAPGLHVRAPWPIEDHKIVPIGSVRRLELGFRTPGAQGSTPRTLARDRLTVGGPSNPVPQAITETGVWFQKEPVTDEFFLLTGDGNLIDMRLTVQYRAQDPVAFAYRVAEPEALVRGVTLAVLGGIATSGIDAIYTDAREPLEREVAQRLQQLIDRYGAGIEVLSVRLLYVHPPDAVHSAFRDVASAQEDKMYTVNRAKTFAVEAINLAQGEAAAMIEQALGFKEQRVLRAQGDAAAFTLKLAEYQRAPELTRFRLQLEAIEQVLPGVRKLVRPAAEDVNELDFWLLEPFGSSTGQ